jgi:hypothetical protein
VRDRVVLRDVVHVVREGGARVREALLLRLVLEAARARRSSPPAPSAAPATRDGSPPFRTRRPAASLRTSCASTPSPTASPATATRRWTSSPPSEAYLITAETARDAAALLKEDTIVEDATREELEAAADRMFRLGVELLPKPAATVDE